MAEERKVKSRERPTSPHLQVYKPQLTSVTSILHRVSVVVSYVAVILFAHLIYKEAFFVDCDVIKWLTGTENGKLVTKVALSGFAVAVSYWIFATTRHLFFDIGKGFELSTANKTAWLSILASLGFAAYIIIYGVL